MIPPKEHTDFTFKNFVLRPHEIETDAPWKHVGLIVGSIFFNFLTLCSFNIGFRCTEPDPEQTKKIGKVSQKHFQGVEEEKDVDLELLIKNNEKDSPVEEIPTEDLKLMEYIKKTLPKDQYSRENAPDFVDNSQKVDAKFFKTVMNLEEQGNIGDYKIQEEKSHLTMEIKLNNRESVAVMLKKSTTWSKKDVDYYRLVVSDGKGSRWSKWAFTKAQISVMVRGLRGQRPEEFTIATSAAATFPVSGLVIFKEKKTGAYFLVNEKGALQKVEDVPFLSNHVKSCLYELARNKN